MLPPEFIKPRYGSTSFADIPQSLQYLFTGTGSLSLSPEIFGGLLQPYDTVILFLVDAFGWNFFEKYREHDPFLKSISQAGVVSQLTAQFPSTTAAHVTCIHTGLPPGQSGVYEWQYYDPELDALIAPLLFSFAGTKERETLKPTGVNPETLYPTRTIYPALARDGVSSYVIQHRTIARTTYSDMMFSGATIVPYQTLPEALINLDGLLRQQSSPAYYFLYFGDIDSLGHRYGPNSPQIEAEIDIFLTTMDRWFLQKQQGKLKKTLFIMTADHGQVALDPKTTIYLNLDPRFDGIEHFLKTNRKGDLLVPAGSSRDMFLYIKDDLLDEAETFLAERLAGKAVVYATQRLIEAGFFGPDPVSPAFLNRVGNLVILPYANESVWWYVEGKFEAKSYGSHGGLTRPEMEIPFLLYNFS